MRKMIRGLVVPRDKTRMLSKACEAVGTEPVAPAACHGSASPHMDFPRMQHPCSPTSLKPKLHFLEM